jgi:hypothetical protein
MKVLPKTIKLKKGWTDPQIVETQPGTFTLAVTMNEESLRNYTEKDRIKLTKLARVFLETKLKQKILTLIEYQKKLLK